MLRPARRLRGRVGVLGDVHAEDVRLDSALAAMRTAGVGEVLCVGDLADGRGDLTRTCELLAAASVQCVLGNHDRWALADELRELPEVSALEPPTRTFLASLPVCRSYSTPRGGLLLCHGVGRDDMAEVRLETSVAELASIAELERLRVDTATAMMVGGHTHQAMTRDLGDLLVINAGTLRYREERDVSFLVLDLEPRESGRSGRLGWIERWIDAGRGRWVQASSGDGD